jgi:hypothetical protein
VHVPFHILIVNRTIQQLGASFGELTIAPATPTEPLPPLPVEVDDIHIFPEEIHPQQPGIVPIVAGFNVNVRIFLTYSSLSTAEMAFGMDEIFDWDRQQRIFEQSLQRCRQILDSLPEVLKVRSKGAHENIAQIAQPKQPYFPPLPDFDGMRDPALNNFASPEAQDLRRYEIQKANIYATHLATRSYLVEKYFMLLDKAAAKAQNSIQSSPSILSTGLDRFVSSNAADAAALEKTMSEERELVVKDLLVVLGAIDMVNMEPNGDSFVSILSGLRDSDFLYDLPDTGLSCPTHFLLSANIKNISPIPSLRFVATQTQKIRSIASTLLEVPKERKGSVALQHQDYLYKFLDILSKLERVSPEASDPSASVDEETELRLWADLRDHQLKFQEQGGVYGFA